MVARDCALMRIMATCQLPLVRATYVPADREKFPLPNLPRLYKADRRVAWDAWRLADIAVVE
jgi:hypothetical protein